MTISIVNHHGNFNRETNLRSPTGRVCIYGGGLNGWKLCDENGKYLSLGEIAFIVNRFNREMGM